MDTDASTPTPAERLPARFETTTFAADARELPDDTPARLAGRVVLWRQFGGLCFGHVLDGTGTVQFSIKRDELGDEAFDHWNKEIGVGDFVGLGGVMYTTRKGEKTLGATEIVILQRAQRQMPDKWAGIASPEVRYRKRYLDLIANQESRERFRTRFAIIQRIRSFLEANRFVEVETPILQDAAAGAAARPFITHHNALDQDFYLRISPETYLKRVVAGSFDRVFEIGRNFRNEGTDPSHLQEFTMLEWYAAYWDFRDNMRFVRELILAVLDDVIGSRVVEFQGVALDFDGDWPELDFRDEVQRRTGIDLRALTTLDALKPAVAALDLDVDVNDFHSWASLVDALYKRTVRPHLIQPCFVTNQPTELVPLARRNDDDPTQLDMFQVVVNEWEIVKAYSELVDPVDQLARLQEQVALREAGDDETMMLEEDFIECMEYGMPPMSGLGLGIDRFVALLTDAPNLRDVVLFPSMRRVVGDTVDHDGETDASETIEADPA